MSSSSTEVDYVAHHHKVKGLNPAANAGADGNKKMGKAWSLP